MTTAKQTYEMNKTARGVGYADNQLARAVVAKLKTEHATMGTVPAELRAAVNALMARPAVSACDTERALALGYLA